MTRLSSDGSFTETVTSNPGNYQPVQKFNNMFVRFMTLLMNICFNEFLLNFVYFDNGNLSLILQLFFNILQK